jgi:hypothetical protein
MTGGKKVTTKEKRWFKDVGLGFKTPSEAISGTYIGTSLSSRCSFIVDTISQIKSAPLLVIFRSVAVFSLGKSCQPR